MAISQHMARSGLVETPEDPHQRGLASPVRAQQADHFTALDGQADTAHDRALLEAFAHVRGVQAAITFGDQLGAARRLR